MTPYLFIITSADRNVSLPLMPAPVQATPTVAATIAPALGNPAAPVLPITGSRTGLFGGTGIVILAAGVGLVLFARSRRVRPTPATVPIAKDPSGSN